MVHVESLYRYTPGWSLASNNRTVIHPLEMGLPEIGAWIEKSGDGSAQWINAVNTIGFANSVQRFKLL